MPIDLTSSGEEQEESISPLQPSIRRRHATKKGIPTPPRRLSTYTPNMQAFYIAYYTPEEIDPEKILVTSDQMNNLRNQIRKLKEEESRPTSSANPTIIQPEAEEDFIPDEELNPNGNTRRNKQPSLEESHRASLEAQLLFEKQELSKGRNSIAAISSNGNNNSTNDQLDVLNKKGQELQRIRAKHVNLFDLASFLKEREEEEKTRKEAEEKETVHYLSQELVNELFNEPRPEASSNPISRASTPDSFSNKSLLSGDSAYGSSADIKLPEVKSPTKPSSRLTESNLKKYLENGGRNTTV